MRTKQEKQEPDEMRRNPENYKWGIFYVNRNDPRMIVPRRIKWMGWTLNFANPYSWLALSGFITCTVWMASAKPAKK